MLNVRDSWTGSALLSANTSGIETSNSDNGRNAITWSVSQMGYGARKQKDFHLTTGMSQKRRLCGSIPGICVADRYN